MQEEINQRAIVISKQSAQFTARMLAKALKKWSETRQRAKMYGSQSFESKHSVKELLSKGADLPSVEITDDNIKAFEEVARKHDVKFELKCNKTEEPPIWYAFFKARDADKMTKAFDEFTDKILGREAEKAKKPAIMESLKKAIESVRARKAKDDPIKEKAQEQSL